MPKLGMEPIRRRQLIEATYEVLRREGFANTTLAKIAAEAGLATSIITHYFSTKSALIEATMRDQVASLVREASVRRAAATTNVEEVIAIVDANFALSQCSPRAVAAWLYFWGQVPYNPSFARIQKICDRRLLLYLQRSLRTLVPDAEVYDVAYTILALSYGFWMQLAHFPKEFDVERARNMALEVIETRVHSAWAKERRFSLSKNVVGLLHEQTTTPHP
jgi:TetR/AcrR family transcriptional repressor of bet genes